jgi:multiple sugar transport system permease protein
VICSLAAYAFARVRFRGRDATFVTFLSTLMVPQIVTLIPAYLIIHTFGWLNTYWALIVPFVNSVWGIFLLRQFFLALPRDLDEAARLDGASELTVLVRIILPLAKPALTTLAVFAFISTWQSFLWPLVVTDRMEMRPVEVGIAMFQSLYTRNWPYQMAAAVTAMVPTIIIFAIAQRQFTRGIALTGMKG